jgi:hypothetical protein
MRRWQNAAEHLQQLAELLPAGSERADVLVRLGTLYRDAFGDPRAGAEAFERALNDDPLHLAGLGKLILLLEKGHIVPLEVEIRLDRAAESARELLRQNPDDERVWAALIKVATWRKDEDWRKVLEQVLALVKGESAAERPDVPDPKKPISSDRWQALYDAQSSDLWSELRPVASLFYRSQQADEFMVKSNRIDAKKLPAVEKIALALGCIPVVYQAPVDVCEVFNEAIIVGPWAFAPLDSYNRYRLAFQLTMLRDGIAPLDRLGPDELRLFLAACARLGEVVPPPAELGSVWSTAESLTKRLDDVIGRKERKILRTLGARHGQVQALVAFRQSQVRGAQKAAFSIAADMAAALRQISPEDAVMMRMFAASNEFAALRRELVHG